VNSVKVTPIVVVGLEGGEVGVYEIGGHRGDALAWPWALALGFAKVWNIQPPFSRFDQHRFSKQILHPLRSQ
jgi:hypothetical protein